MKNSARHSTGMTLIEVLVTLVIISVGLLGVAALQLTTVRNNYDAFTRSQAAVLASDMLDRIRANREDAYDNLYNGAGYGNPITGATIPVADINSWKATLAAQLPNGEGEIVTVLVGEVLIATIRVRWRERAEADPLVFTTSSQI
jgi:type IV pilus assembly protein PilV